MNRLAAETSPYLLQHADNPVDWHPWGEEALRLAREQDRPILLSIGYSACHWCHVMAHESFEHPETAALMNELFVNIKVDREERPDLDRIYQTAHQLLAQRPGGWPLTVFLMPDDQAPFFAGTYFPREARFGMPAFRDVLKRLRAAYDEQRDALRQQNSNLQGLLERLNPAPADNDIALTASPIREARRQLEAEFDADNGGFGGAPKFPHPSNLEFLLRHADADGDLPAMRMVNFTLQKMATGGLYDHLGGGFFRYCVDTHWNIPHFEKMLYDNAPLLGLYADAWRITREPMYRRVVEETVGWLQREMRSPEGGFYSTLDADTDGREGGYYVWTPEAVANALERHSDSEVLLEFVTEHFGLNRRANFDREWHLVIHKDIDALAAEHEADPADVRALIDSARESLFAAREERARPNRDEKVLTSWNALTVRGLAQASRALENDEFMHIAEQTVDFIRARLWQDGRLLASFKDGEARFPAYLDDYAFLIDALMELLETRWRTQDLEFATELADALLEHFQDRKNGGFFFTADDHESLLFRPKPLGDDSTPSGNGIAARALWRLGQLLAEPRYLEAAENTLRAAWPALKRAPYAHATLLDTLRDQFHAGATVILRGEKDLMPVWRNKVSNGPARNHHVYCIPADAGRLPQALAEKPPQGDCVAYVCRGFTCSPPMHDRDQLHRELQEMSI